MSIPARIARERLARRRANVADQPADARVGIAPRIDEKRVEIRREQHVRLLDAHEAFDRRAVEHDVAGQRLLELRRRNLDVLVDAKNVGELQPHEANVQLLGEIENVLLRSAGRVRRERAIASRQDGLGEGYSPVG